MVDKKKLRIFIKIGDGRPFIPDEWLDGIGCTYGAETDSRPEDWLEHEKITSRSCWRVHYRMWHVKYDNYFLHGKWESTEGGEPLLHVWDLNLPGFENGK